MYLIFLLKNKIFAKVILVQCWNKNFLIFGFCYTRISLLFLKKGKKTKQESVLFVVLLDMQDYKNRNVIN